MVSQGQEEAEKTMLGSRQLAHAQPLLNALSEHVVVQDTEHTVIWANEAAARSVDGDGDDLQGKHCHQVWANRKTPCPSCPVENALRTGEPQQGEITTEDGRAWLVRATPLRNEQGDVVGAVETTLEVTEQKQAARALHETDERFRKLFELSPDTVFLVDEDGVFETVNALTITDYDREGIVGRHFSEVPFLTDEARQMAMQLLEQRRNGDSISPYTIPVTTKDGDVRYAEVNTVQLPDGDILGVARDVTEQRKLLEELRESEQRFRTVFEHAMVGVYKTTPDGHILMANPALVDMLGYDSFEELAERDLERDGFEPSYDRKRFKRAIEDNDLLTGLESSWRRKDGTTLHVRENAKAVRDDSGELQYYLGTVEDIDDRKAAEEKITELNDTLRLINKIMRHDILNDVQIAQSALELYREGEDKELLEKAVKRMQQGVSLIKRMRGLESMVATGKELEAVDVRAVAEEVTGDCDIECTVEGSAVVLADEALHSLLRNLVDNAVKHGDASRVTVEIGRSSDRCKIRVVDDGKGISDEIKQQVFAEGFSHGDQAASGLGLYIVKKTVERYGGSIEVEDNEPQGCVFVIRLKKREGKHE